METCSIARIMNLWDLAVRPKNLCHLLIRLLQNLLLKECRKDEHVHPPPMETTEAANFLPELPQDMLMVIFALLEIPDLVRAGSVCHSWHSAYASLRDMGQYKQQQTPCLLYTTVSSGENVACLYSLVEKRSYKLTLPEPPLHSRLLIGSSHGWVITADEMSELHLVNPITGEQIALPSVMTIEHVKPILNDTGVVRSYKIGWYSAMEVYRQPYGEPPIYTPSELRDLLYYKAFVFPDPLTRSFIVVVIHSPYGQLSFARAGDDKWNWLPPNIFYRDCVYHDGLLYALTKYGEIDAFDITASIVTRKLIFKKLKNVCESMYIIRAPWGDLLQVWRKVDFAEQEDSDDDALFYESEDGIMRVFRTKGIKVFKVDMATNKLVKIDRLPDHLLFLGHNQSVCLRAEEYPQLRGNHVYFMDNHGKSLLVNKNCPRDVGVFDLENCRRKKILSPHIWSIWPGPIWITPSLIKMNRTFSTM